MTENEAARLLALLAAAWPEKELPTATARLYLDALSSYEFETGQRAVQRIIRTTEWFPRIAALREHLEAASPHITTRALPAPRNDPELMRWGLDLVRDALRGARES